MEFTKEKKTTLTKDALNSFTTKGPMGDFCIIADNEGMYFNGQSPMIENQEQLESLARAVSDAYGCHLRLRMALRNKLMNN
jgi:hypothetical protein